MQMTNCVNFAQNVNLLDPKMDPKMPRKFSLSSKFSLVSEDSAIFDFATLTAGQRCLFLY